MQFFPDFALIWGGFPQNKNGRSKSALEINKHNREIPRMRTVKEAEKFQPKPGDTAAVRGIRKMM